MAKQGSFKLVEDEKITTVMVTHGYIVDGIGFEITDKNGNKTTKSFSDNPSPNAKSDKISLGANEYVTQISGTYGKYFGKDVYIATLKIHTNINPNGYGPYGRGQETQDIKAFTTPTPIDGTIVGFSASYGPYLASIGIFATGIERQGPYGSAESTNWSIEIREGLRFSKVVVNHGYIVDGIGFEVTDAEGNVETKMFSGPGGSRSEIPLGPNEHITKISGEYGEYGAVSITSIKIHTNLRPTGYGPYGQSKNAKNVKPFSTLPLAGSVVGFFGNYGRYLGSIGTIDNKYNGVKEFGPYGRH